MKNARKRKITEILMSAIFIIAGTLCGLVITARFLFEEAHAAPPQMERINIEINVDEKIPEAKGEHESGVTTLAYVEENSNWRVINLANVITDEEKEETFDVDNSRSPSMSAMNPEKEENVEEIITMQEFPIQEEVNHNDYYFGMIDYTEKDVFYVAAEIYVESRGEPYEGKVGVGASIVNRLMHPDFPDTIYGVITQENQFASISWVTKEMIDQVPECWEAAIEALNGIDPTFERTGEHALYFYNPAGCSQSQLNARANIKNTCTIGAHVFYRNW